MPRLRCHFFYLLWLREAGWVDLLGVVMWVSLVQCCHQPNNLGRELVAIDTWREVAARDQSWELGQTGEVENEIVCTIIWDKPPSLCCARLVMASKGSYLHVLS